MRLWLRIPAPLVLAVVLCSAQTPAQSPATTAPADSAPVNEGPVQTPPLVEPPVAARAPVTAAPAPTVQAAPVPAPAPAPATKDPSLEPPPTKKPSAAAAPPKTPGVPNITEGADGKPYVIGSLDVLYIRVWNNSNLTGMFDVGPDGMISMSLVGEIKADGLTRAQLIEQLKTKLADYLNNPEVDVQVTKVNSKKFLIVGAVGRPGDYPLVGKIAIFEALTNAGVTEAANKKKIYLLRGTKKYYFNYNEVLQGKKMDQDITIENGDRIVVPQ